MEFDKSKVYTALNADEVKPGSRVFAADNLSALKQKVENDYYQDLFTLDEVLPPEASYRFRTETIDFMLCYLVSEPKAPRRMTNRELARWLAQGNGQWMGTFYMKGTSYSYSDKDTDKVPDKIMIRGWDEDTWHEPVVEEADG